MKEVKIGMKPELDMKKFKNLSKEREKIIDFGFSDSVKAKYKTNELVEVFHPQSINVKVKKIETETADTKSFYLVPVDREEFPPFEAGQYITLEVKINNGIYKRAYTISSSSSNRLEYRITIKREYQGIVSNYMLEECAEQDILSISAPFGTFKYNSIRDQEEILAIAGGSGITPFMAMAYSCVEKSRPEKLTILYGSKTVEDIILKKELDELMKKSSRLKVIYVLSEEKHPNYEYGMIDKEKILNQTPFEKSIFVCGPLKMYQSLNSILKELDIPNKYIRHEAYAEIPDDLSSFEHQLHIHTQKKIITIPCFENRTLLRVMEENGIKAPVHCTVGVCGFCRSKLLDGKVKTENADVREADKSQNYIHPCVTYPLSDVTIELPF